MYRRPYIESSAFIAFVRGENRGDHDCRAVMDSILQAAEEGNFRIYTSALTIAEVFKNKKQGVQLTNQENEDLTPYFRTDYIRIIEVDRQIGERANELCRSHRPNPPDVPPLRPNDAIHLACAERADCDVLYAYDADLTKQTHPDIDIKWPELIVRVAIPGYLALGPGAPPIQEMLALTAGDEVHEKPIAAGEPNPPAENPQMSIEELGESTTEAIEAGSQTPNQPLIEDSNEIAATAAPQKDGRSAVEGEKETAVTETGDKEKGADDFKAPAPTTL